MQRKGLPHLSLVGVNHARRVVHRAGGRVPHLPLPCGRGVWRRPHSRAVRLLPAERVESGGRGARRAVPFAHLGGSKRRPNTVAFILTAGMDAANALERILDDVAKALERCPPVCQPQMAVTVPAGVGPGDAFVVIGPSGEQIMVSCPHESKAGEEILVMVPNASAAVAPTPAVMVTAAPIVVEGEAVTPVG